MFGLAEHVADSTITVNKVSAMGPFQCVWRAVFGFDDAEDGMNEPTISPLMDSRTSRSLWGGSFLRKSNHS